MDKQIIIDGVNVKKCKYFYRRTKECVNEDTIDALCEEFSNCYYKQLKRAEQRIVELNNTIQAKEQECEELKKQLTILDDEDVVVEITVKQFEEYKKLKQTLTEIKEIAEKNLNIHTCAFKGCGYDLITKQILQKISECEGNDD